jgi:tetratricopeptide (TPR) repeat protein
MAKSSPEPSGYLEGLAWLARRDHLGQAEAAFRAGLAMEPEHAGCTLQLGVTLRVLGRLGEAAEVLGRALQLAPTDPEVHLQLGNLHHAQGRLEAALAEYDAALGLAPASPYIRFRRARTLQDLHRLGEALASYDQLAAGLDPETAASYHLAERRTEVTGRLAILATHGINPALPPQQRAATLYRRANALVLENALDRAVALYEQAALLAPDYRDPEFRLGETVPVQLERQPRGDYPSCRWIEEGLFFLQSTTLGFCCTYHTDGKASPLVGSFHGGPVPVDFVLARRQQLRNENQACADNACRGCQDLASRTWDRHPWLFGALICGNHTVCNQKCSYCTQADSRMPAYYYMVAPAIEQLIAHGWLSPKAYVALGGGEPTLSREFPDISARLLRHGCRLNLMTNATRLVPAILEALRQGRCDLVTSVDSGTPRTYYRMKYRSESTVMLNGRPAFETVWAHLAEYARACSDRVFVKYIFTPDNLAEADLQGYLDLCLANGITRIMLSPEAGQILNDCVPEAIWRAIHRTKQRAHARGLTVLFHVPFFRPDKQPVDLSDGPILSQAERTFTGMARHGSTWSRDRDDFMDLMRMVATPPPTA